MTQNNVTTTYTYDANNRLTAETAAGVATTYTYDNNGNLINAWNAGNPVGAYSYNLFGNQVSYTPDGVVFTNYTYRPDGLRHSIGDKIHVWDAANIVADVDGNDIVVYFRGINLIYADDGSRTYYHFNAHGDVIVLTNASGTKTKSYSYNAFGVEYNEATLDDNPFRYCGEYYDKETKTIYLRARYYDSAQGRFTQEDPIRDGYNWYSYCDGNPVNCIDPTGLASIFSDIFTKGGVLYPVMKCLNILYNHYRGKNGCGPIAIYNAMIALHKPQSLADIVTYAEIKGMNAEGFFGMESSVVSDYLEMQGCKIVVTRDILDADALLKEYGHAIILQWNDADNMLKGQHYVYIQYQEFKEKKIEVYNAFSDYGDIKGYDSIQDYMKTTNATFIEATCIYSPRYYRLES